MDNNKYYNAAFELVSENAKKFPDKTAFIDDNNAINYLELKKKIVSFSYHLATEVLEQNDKVLICMLDNINYPISFLGCIWSGIIPICINTMLPKEDLKYMLEDSEAKAVICSSELLEVFLELRNDINEEIFIISDFKDKSKVNNKNLDLKSFLTHKNLDHQPENTSEDSECFWLYSSGSTGSPKGTIHLHKNLLNTANLYAKNTLKINKDDIFYSAAKLFFAYGLGNALTFPLSVAGTSILTKERPTSEVVAKIINKHKVTLFFGVPTLYATMLNSKLNINDFKSLRLSVSAGEALPDNLCNKWTDIIGTKVLDGIGSTEMLHIFISNSIDEIVPGASGRPIEGYEARLVKDDGHVADDNEIGELEIRGPTSAKAYWNKPEKTKATFLGEWTKTGDKYLRNKKGIYTYCGRADDMMKVSGQYVSPFEIEAVLQSHENVLEAAVIGAKDKDGLLKPKAYIVLNNKFYASDKLEKELTDHVKNILTPFKYPRWYEFVKSLPKTATGKIQRFKLRND